MATVHFTTSCTACSGDWRVLAHDSGCKQYSYCDRCTARVFHGLPEHVGEQCACGCLERIEDGQERIEADGRAYIPWHYVSVCRELAGVERFDDEADCEAEVARLRAAYVAECARVAKVVDGSLASFACDALGGLVLAAVMVAPLLLSGCPSSDERPAYVRPKSSTVVYENANRDCEVHRVINDGRSIYVAVGSVCGGLVVQ